MEIMEIMEMHSDNSHRILSQLKERMHLLDKGLEFSSNPNRIITTALLIKYLELIRLHSTLEGHSRLTVTIWAEEEELEIPSIILQQHLIASNRSHLLLLQTRLTL